ncbi:hypothetical protein [Streptomyces sp. NPDC050255]|uniref:hypothetical protein n=1 Tax=Streptomyces sp. NPDC050255 TaxID=3365606 RepID=UPI0037899F45
MSTNDPGTPDSSRPPQRARARSNPTPGSPPPLPPSAPGPAEPGSGVPPVHGLVPRPVSRLRTMLIILGCLQALPGLSLIINSDDFATSIWDEPGEAQPGAVVLVGVLVLAVAAWGITTAFRFPTQQPSVLTSARAYSWTGVPYALLMLLLSPILGAIVVVLVVLVIVRPNHPECRAWFGG